MQRLHQRGARTQVALQVVKAKNSNLVPALPWRTPAQEPQPHRLLRIGQVARARWQGPGDRAGGRRDLRLHRAQGSARGRQAPARARLHGAPQRRAFFPSRSPTSALGHGRDQVVHGDGMYVAQASPRCSVKAIFDATEERALRSEFGYMNVRTASSRPGPLEFELCRREHMRQLVALRRRNPLTRCLAHPVVRNPDPRRPPLKGAQRTPCDPGQHAVAQRPPGAAPGDGPREAGAVRGRPHAHSERAERPSRRVGVAPNNSRAAVALRFEP
jgi:hypothetical protein